MLSQDEFDEQKDLILDGLKKLKKGHTKYALYTKTFYTLYMPESFIHPMQFCCEIVEKAARTIVSISS